MYTTIQVSVDSIQVLKKAKSLFTDSEVQVFYETGEFDRMSMDGVYTVVGSINSKKVALIISDFRVCGGSFSKKNSKRVCAFIREATDIQLPIVFALNSFGVRFTEGRTIFDEAFSIIKCLAEFRKNNLLITLGLGNVLGLGALIFAQGHYRLAVDGEAKFNLTGPEIHKIFFGTNDSNFGEFTNSNHQFHINTLIHEIHPSESHLYRAANNLINLFSNSNKPNASYFNNYSNETETGGLVLRSREQELLLQLEKQLGDEVLELFTQKGSIVRIYIGKVENKIIGFITNPPGHPNNMLNVSAVDKSIAAIELFKALKIPVVSILDTPGGDPRRSESDQDAIMKMINLTHLMIDYPYKKMGIINGRCYGGAAMFNFPKIFGGDKLYAIQGAKIGVMSKSIIDEILSKAVRLKEMWNLVAPTETSDLLDLIACGTIDGVIENDDIQAVVLSTLFEEHSMLENEFTDSFIMKKQFEIKSNHKFN